MTLRLNQKDLPQAINTGKALSPNSIDYTKDTLNKRKENILSEHEKQLKELQGNHNAIEAYKQSDEHQRVKKELMAIHRDVMALTNLEGSARLYLREGEVVIEGIEAISKHSIKILAHLFDFNLNQINLSIDEAKNKETILDFDYSVILDSDTTKMLEKKLEALLEMCKDNKKKKKEIEADINLLKKEEPLEIKATKEGMVYLNNSPFSNMSKKLMMKIFGSVECEEKNLHLKKASGTA